MSGADRDPPATWQEAARALWAAGERNHCRIARLVGKPSSTIAYLLDVNGERARHAARRRKLRAKQSRMTREPAWTPPNESRVEQRRRVTLPTLSLADAPEEPKTFHIAYRVDLNAAREARIEELRRLHRRAARKGLCPWPGQSIADWRGA